MMSGVIWRMTRVLSVGSVDPSTAAATDAGDKGVELAAPAGTAVLPACEARVVGALILVDVKMVRWEIRLDGNALAGSDRRDMLRLSKTWYLSSGFDANRMFRYVFTVS